MTVPNRLVLAAQVRRAAARREAKLSRPVSYRMRLLVIVALALSPWLCIAAVLALILKGG